MAERAHPTLLKVSGRKENANSTSIMADEAERKRKRVEETAVLSQSALQNINRGALIYPNKASMVPELECPICHDLMLVPIQCRRGHSVCAHCARQVASTAAAAGAAGSGAAAASSSSSGDAMCPTCRGPMNLDDPTINFALQRMIDRLACRCPNAVAASGHGSAGGEGGCPWRGTFEVLEAHLRVCGCAPAPCPFAPHGCTAVLTAAAMKVHHVERAAYHSGLVADRFSALEKRFTDMESTLKTRIAEVETSVTSVSARVDGAVRSSTAASTAVTALASAVPPSSDWTVRWFIYNVPQKIQQKAKVHSKRFTVQAPGLGTYVMQFQGTFTRSGEFSFFINVMRDGCPAHAPTVRLEGTSIELYRPYRASDYGSGQNLVRNFGDTATAAPGSGFGFETFCDDVNDYINDDKSIVFNVQLQLQTEVVWV
jgi:hypothetical protein